MVSDEYLAGLLDGEGTIGINHRPRRDDGRREEMQSHIVVSFTMCDREPLDAIVERFGGKVHKLTTEPTWRTPYRWQSHSRAGEELLRAARPYLLVKHRQADLALEFRATLMQGGRANPERAKMNADVIAKRLRLRKEIRALNRRGT